MVNQNTDSNLLIAVDNDKYTELLYRSAWLACLEKAGVNEIESLIDKANDIKNSTEELSDGND